MAAARPRTAGWTVVPRCAFPMPTRLVGSPLYHLPCAVWLLRAPFVLFSKLYTGLSTHTAPSRTLLRCCITAAGIPAQGGYTAAWFAVAAHASTPNQTGWDTHAWGLPHLKRNRLGFTYLISVCALHHAPHGTPAKSFNAPLRVDGMGVRQPAPARCDAPFQKKPCHHVTRDIATPERTSIAYYQQYHTDAGGCAMAVQRVLIASATTAAQYQKRKKLRQEVLLPGASTRMPVAHHAHAIPPLTPTMYSTASRPAWFRGVAS